MSTHPLVRSAPSAHRGWAILVAVVLAALIAALAPGPMAAAAPADGAVRTFDDEPLGDPPADCETIGDVSVAEAGFGGAPATNRAMRLVDESSSVYTRAWCSYPQTDERSVSYRFSPAQLDVAPYVAIQGAPGTSTNGVWRFTFHRDGEDIRIAAYDGSSFADVGRIDRGAAPGRWVEVTLNATLEKAELIVNGVRFETDRRNAPSPTMGDVFFGSGGQSPVGTDYYIDDLAVSGELPDDAFAGITLEPVLEGASILRYTEIVDEPVARFQLPEGPAVTDFSATALWQDETIPMRLSGPDEEGWVTATITHTFPRAGAGTLRTVLTDAAGITSSSTQRITIAGDLSHLTFESDPVGSLPSDCSPLGGHASPAVSEEASHEGERSLRLQDASAETSAGLTCATLPQQGAYLSFQVNPRSLEGFTVDLIGGSLVPTGHPGNSLFRLALREDGSIEWYEQWTATWHELSPAGSVPTDGWTQVELAVPSDNAALRVSVGGEYVGSAGSTIGNNSSQRNEITEITGLALTTGADGATATGDDVFVDDITFSAPEDTPPAAVGTAPFGIGDTVTIDDSGEQVGFPNPGVVVPGDDGGERVLIPYSGHPDVDDAGGIFLGGSDDGGESWFDAQDLNPMPDTSGVTMTRLRSGELLAVNFHAYMEEGSENRRALVETAVSEDGGASWTHREGAMTTPEPMRPIGASERPGTTLGGFVLLHTIVEDPDGTLYMSAYGYYEDDTHFRQVVLVSHDGGIDWEVSGTVAAGDPEQADVTAYEGPSEGAIERLPDGSLLMVMRVGWRLPMLASRSTDDGATWSEPEEIEVGPAGQDLLSVQPTLELLPTGELLLMVGRPGIVMTVSESGLGDDWSVPVGIDYANTENGSFTVLDPTTVLVAGDRGRAEPWEVWSREVTVDPPCEDTITGEHDGPVTAGAGGLCLIDAEVDGSVRVTDGGRLIVQDSEVTGAVTTAGASTVSVCGARIEGPVAVNGTTGGVSLGDTTAGCDPSTLVSSLRVTGTEGPVVIDRSEVTGRVTLSGNSSGQATVISGLTVGGSLSCTDNAVAPTEARVAADVQGARRGECAL